MKTPSALDVRTVFEHWAETLNHKAAVFDKKRQNRIKARLGEGFTVDDLKLVPLGVLKSAWHMGDNPQQTIYTGVETVFRDAEQVEKFIALARKNTNGTANYRSRRTDQDVIEESIEFYKNYSD